MMKLFQAIFFCNSYFGQFWAFSFLEDNLHSSLLAPKLFSRACGIYRSKYIIHTSLFRMRYSIVDKIYTIMSEVEYTVF